MIKMKVLTIIFILILQCNYCLGQVFKSEQVPPPPTINKSKDPSQENKIFKIDTLIAGLNIEYTLLENHEQKPILKELNTLNHSHFAQTPNNIFVAGTNTEYQGGTPVNTYLIIYVLDTHRRMVATDKLSCKKGITIISVTADKNDFYVMYQKAISSSDRDLYITKFNNKAEEVWSYKVGKRFGTRGLGLLKMINDKTLIALTNHYNKVGFDILSSDGQYQERKVLNVVDELKPTSFIVNNKNEIIVVGSLKKYKGSGKYSSGIVFSVDQDYKPTFYKEFSSDFTDYGLDIKMNSNHDYILFLNSVKYSGPYNKRYKISTLLLLNKNFEVKEKLSLYNKDDSSKNRLFISEDNSIYFYQKNKKLEIYMLTENLEILNTYNLDGNYRDASYINIVEGNKLVIGGGGSRSSWLFKSK